MIAERAAGRRHPPALEPPGRVRLRTLVNIRWVAVAGQLVTLLAVHFGLGFALPIAPALAVVAGSALLNAALTFTQPLNLRLGDRPAALYLAYDTLQLAALLFLTGGLVNPFYILILAPVTVSATVLSRESTIGLGLLSGICITTLAVWHLPFPWSAGGIDLPDMCILGVWEALVIGTLFIAAYVGSVAEEARILSDALAATQMALMREQRMSALGAQAAAAAHELGSPLATIAVTANEMAQELPQGSPLAADVDLLIGQSERCRRILAGLARNPEADGGPAYSQLPVTALVRSAAEPHRTSDIHVEFLGGGADPSAPEPTVGRSPEILHGLGNLLQNAVQFARDRVVVDTSWDEDEITVIIDDDGPGIAANLLGRLGEPYLSSRADDEHMGLGIFIARTLLERTGAVVEFANRPEGGARVVVAWQRHRLDDILSGASGA